MNKRILTVTGSVMFGLALASCSSGTGPSGSPTTTPTPGSPATTAPAATTATTAATPVGTALCPTAAQANAALGVTDRGPTQTLIAGGVGVECEYAAPSGAANAVVTIFAHQSPSVFAGQVAHAPGAPAMASISGVGDGAFGQTAGGRSNVNAYSNASRTLVAANAPGPIAPVEALARVALADN